MAEGYVRTKVRAKNPSRGVYRTLDGLHEIRMAAKKGTWDVFRLVDGGARRIEAGVKGYDRALDRILEEPGVTLAALNTAPARVEQPKVEAPKVERDETDRRSGATGEAPKSQPKGGRPHVNRGGRKVA
jgi:hypothetical protein